MTPLAGPRRRARTLALVAVLAAACSGGDASDPAAEPGEPSVPTTAAVIAPAVPAPSPPGTGVVVVGGSTSSFAVTSCRLEPDPSEPVAARAMAVLVGEGTTGSGVPFTVEVRRFATGTDVVTFTDTVTYTDGGRILQAQRIEVNGQVTDLREPRAATPLVRTRGDGLSAAGLAGPPGGGADDEGIIGIALDATC